MRNGVDVIEEEVKATFRRLDVDKDARVTFSELKRLFNLNSGVTSKTNSFSKSSSTFHDSKGSRGFSDSPLKSSLRSPIRSALRSPIRSPVRTTTNRFFSPNNTNKYTSPLRERTLNVLEMTNQRLNKSLRRSPELLRNSSALVNSSRNGFKSTSQLNNYVTFEEENFISYFKDLLDMENEIEKAKCDLVIKSDFNPEDAFGIFEMDRRGYLSDLDVKYGLNTLDVYPTQEEINLLLKRFDLRGEGILR